MPTIPTNRPAIKQAVAKGFAAPVVAEPSFNLLVKATVRNKWHPERTTRGTWSLTLELACRVVSVANRKDHWTSTRRRTEIQGEALQKALASAGLLSHIPPLPVVATLTHIGKALMDEGSLIRAFEALRGHLAKWIDVADDDARIRWVHDQHLGSPAVVVKIEGVRRGKG